jgi:hypothetical protein
MFRSMLLLERALCMRSEWVCVCVCVRARALDVCAWTFEPIIFLSQLLSFAAERNPNLTANFINTDSLKKKTCTNFWRGKQTSTTFYGTYVVRFLKFVQIYSNILHSVLKCI